MTPRVFDMARVSAHAYFPRGLQGIDAEVIQDYAFDMLAARLTAFVLTEKLADETKAATLEVPASWWQHFKRDRAPRWFRHFRPARFTTMTATVHFTAKGIYPEAGFALPPETFGGRVIFETIDSGQWRAPGEPE